MSQANAGPSPKNTGIGHNNVMNAEQIYCKTPEGERALVQRTRLVQRNLRNVLILVDGVATVADLTRKLGDGNFLRASLGELLRGGFVETVEENRVRRGLEAVNAPEGEPKTIPVPDPTPQPISLPPQLESILPEHSRWREDLEATVDDALLEPEPETVREPPAYIEPARKEPFWRRWFGARPRQAAVATDDAPAPALAPRETETSDRKPVKVRIKPIRRGVASEPRTNWFSRILMALLILLALAVVAIVVFPYDRYRQDIEARASAWLGQPVSVGEVHFSLTPRPGIVLDGVQTGGERGVAIGSVRVVPSLLSLFGNKWRVGTVVLQRSAIDQRAILALLDPRKAPVSDAVKIEKIAVEGATLSFAGMAVEDVSGSIALTPEANIEEIDLRTGDGSLRLTVLPQPKSGLKLSLTSTGWRLPWRGGVPVDSIAAEGLLTRTALRIDKMEIRTLGGAINGSGNIDWQQQVALSLQGSYARVGVPRLMALVEPAVRVQGEVSGKISLRASAVSFDSLGRALSGGGSFSLDRGTLDGFDLVEAVRSRSEAPIRGGSTKLEEFGGNISLDGGAWKLSGLRGNSGVMSTSGYLNQTGGKVDGVMDVQLRGSANQVNVPVVISGTLADPLLLARRRSASSPTGEAGQSADGGR